MSQIYKFHQNDVVRFDNGGVKGVAVVVGCATIEMPILGRSYIVRAADGSLPTSEYPFDTTIVAEIHMKRLAQ